MAYDGTVKIGTGLDGAGVKKKRTARDREVGKKRLLKNLQKRVEKASMN